MLSTIALAFLLASLALYALKIYTQFTRNLAAAKKSGIPYFIVPFYQNNRLWQLTHALLEPVLRKLPRSWTQPWLEMSLDWCWYSKYEPFQRFGTDTFLTVSPERNQLYTADPDVVSQITTRRLDFPKALEVYESIRLYGNNVVTSEGETWRHHRKITSPPFTEKNNHLVWNETLEQCQAMVDSWFDGDTAKIKSKTIHTLSDDAMRLSLYVISRAGFGVHMKWPTNAAHAAADATDGQESCAPSSEIASGHTMSYTNALGSILHDVLWVLIIPPLLLSNLPIESRLSAFR